MILAAAGGHATCVTELLEQGADPNARRIVIYINLFYIFIKIKRLYIFFSFQTGTTALFFAAQAGHIEVAKILIRYGAYIDAASLVSRFFCRKIIKTFFFECDMSQRTNHFLI